MTHRDRERAVNTVFAIFDRYAVDNDEARTALMKPGDLPLTLEPMLAEINEAISGDPEMIRGMCIDSLEMGF